MAMHRTDDDDDDVRKIHHTNDPASSKKAAHGHTKSGQRDINKNLVLRLVQEKPGLTAAELWEAAAQSVKTVLKELQEVRRRLTDLKHAGTVSEGRERRCSIRGTPMVTWLPARHGQPTVEET